MSTHYLSLPRRHGRQAPRFALPDASLLRDLIGSGTIRPVRQRRYRHRNATSGDPLHYVLVVAEKLPGRILS